jgi:AraC-like DNA-binding protein
MVRLAQHSRFDTDDPDELCQHLSRLMDRGRTELIRLQRFHLCAHTAPLGLLTVGAVEIIGGGLASHAVYTGYNLVRMEAGGIERRIEGYRPYVLGPGDGSFTGPGQEVMTAHVGGSNLTLTITLPAALVQREAEFLIGEPARQPLEITEPLDLRPSTYLGQRIEYLLDELHRDGGIFEKYPLIGQEIQRELAAALITLTPNNYQPLLRRHHGGPARRHVALAEEYIEAHLREPITVTDMARAAHVSVRTLRDNCHRLRDRTPEMILRSMRLRSAHNRMENPQPHDTVVSIAHEFGFTNAGRFARYYQQEFRGESPAETLQRGRRRLRITLAAQLEKPPS